MRLRRALLKLRQGRRDPNNEYKGSVPVLGVSASVGERLVAAAECCLRVV